MRINGQKSSSSSSYCRGTENQLSLKLMQLMTSPSAELNGSGKTKHLLPGLRHVSEAVNSTNAITEGGGGCLERRGATETAALQL